MAKDKPEAPEATTTTKTATTSNYETGPRRIKCVVAQSEKIKTKPQHPVTGELLAEGDEIELQANWADKFVQSGRGLYKHKRDSLESRLAANTAPKG
jgi:hypothetical protein